MGQQKPNQQPKLNINDPALVQQIIELESRKLANQVQQYALREKELEHNARIAEKSLDYQAQYLQGKPVQDRWTIALIAGSAILLLGLFFFFIVYLVDHGHDDFAKGVLLLLSHTLVGLGAYKAGNKKTHDSGQPFQEAEVVE